MEKLLKYIIGGIVEHPQEVSITSEDKSDYHILHLKVATQDVPKVIGKKGRIIKAVRQIIRVAALLQQQKVFLVLEE